MAVKRDSKLGYGFLLVGASVPYLIDKLFGPVAALLVSLFSFIVGCGFLVHAHIGRSEDGAPSPMKIGGKIAVCLLSLACVVGIFIASWKVYKKPPSDPKSEQQSYSGPSFAISTPVTYKSNPQTPAFWSVVNNYGKSPIHIVVYLRIQSLRSTKIDLQSLVIEGRSANGTWFTFTRIASGATYAVLSSFTEAHPIGKEGFLDQTISEEIEPGGIREGWVLLQYPNAHVNFANQFKVTLTDLAGNSFTSGILESEMNPGSVRGQGLPVEPGIVDISRYVTLGIQP
jgi:hypothetical protein